jgi:TonB-dependent SusC/RagA subfamily outer membrane receptor
MTLGCTGRLRACALVALVCALVVPEAHAQGITGRVTAAGSSEPLPTARVIAVGTPSTAVTGQDGKFTLKHVAPGEIVVQVIRVGYATQKKIVSVDASGNGTADFAMSPTVVRLREIVATGTGEKRSVEVGHSSSDLGDVAAKVERTATNLTINDLLVQKSPSLNVLGQGMVGTGASIRIRNYTSLTQTNDPVIIVDGTRIAAGGSTPGQGVGGSQTSLLNSFTPEEIESIEVLPGPAATSVYGTNAANGVVLITTKKGRVSDAKWQWTAEQGRISDDNDYPSSYAIWGHTPGTPGSVRCLLPTMSATTCVQDSVTSLNILKSSSVSPIVTGKRSLYGVQVSGGTEVVRYYAAGNVENALGPMQMPGFARQRLDSLLVPIRGEWVNPEAWQRENLRMNINATLTPSLDMGLTAGFMKSDQRLPQSDNSPVGVYAAALENPGFDHPGLGYTNVGSLGEALHGYNGWIPSEIFQDLSSENIQRQAMSLSANWRPRPWMANEGSIGLDYANFTDFNVCRLNECPNYITPAGVALRNGQNYSGTRGSRLLTARLASTSTWNPTNRLNVKTTVGTEYVNVESDASLANGLGLPPGAQNVGQAATRTQATNLTETVGKTLGVYAQAQFAHRDRLFVGVGLRSDQNSAFGPDVLWVNYPSANVSWLLSDEQFFPKYSWLDELRLRGAYGASGRQPPLAAATKAYRPDTANIGGADQPGVSANQIGNQALRPETTSEFEAGLASRLLKNRVGFDVSFYRRTTKNAIVSTPIAASSTSPSLSTYINVGGVRGTGIEASLTAQLLDRRNVAWDVTVTASHASNNVLDTGPLGPIVSGNTWLATGYPVDALFYRTYRYSDANSDGRIQPGEVSVDTAMRSFGYQIPRDLASVQSGVDLFSRRLRITALFDHKGGYSVFNAGAAFLCQQFPSCPDESNPNASLADQARSVANRYGTSVGGTSYTTAAGYLSSGQFWRFRELSANYVLPTRFSNRFLRASEASVSFGARNLAVWSPYRGVDPESSFGAGDIQTDFMTAAPPTYYTFRLNLHY